MTMSSIGYIGQRRSSISGHYLLGNGYRGFNPVLKRFAGQDNMSPFGAGGEHGVAYCGGNPVNQSDPSGHLFQRLIELLGFTFAKKAAKKSTTVTLTSIVKISEKDAYATESLTLTDGAALGESSTDTALGESSGLQLSNSVEPEDIFYEVNSLVRQPMAEDSQMYYLSRPGEEQGSFRLTPIKGGESIKPEGVYQYVIRTDERLKVRVGKLATPYGHTSLAYQTREQLVSVRYAGDIIFDNGGGMIKWNNKSGHFQPSAEAAGKLVNDFKYLLPPKFRKLIYWNV